MKTSLPTEITTQSEAENFLRELHENGELIHPEDDAHDIIWQSVIPSFEEKEKLNHLMSQVRSIENFDPFGYVLWLNDVEPEWDGTYED